MQAFEEMAEAIAQLQRKIGGVVRHGTVAEVNPAEGWCRLDWGDGFLSPKITYAQTGGALKLHNAPSVGQAMTAIAPTGDLRQASAHPLGFSDGNPSPSTDGAAHVLTLGGLTVTISDGKVTINGDIETFGDLINDGKNVGHDHTHSGVMSGPDSTGTPD